MRHYFPDNGGRDHRRSDVFTHPNTYRLDGYTSLGIGNAHFGRRFFFHHHDGSERRIDQDVETGPRSVIVETEGDTPANIIGNRE